jgi:hypothetical protein
VRLTVTLFFVVADEDKEAAAAAFDDEDCDALPMMMVRFPEAVAAADGESEHNYMEDKSPWCRLLFLVFFVLY